MYVRSVASHLIRCGRCLVGRMAIFAHLCVVCLCCFVVYVRSVASHPTRCGLCLVGRMAMLERLYVLCLCSFVMYVRSVASHLNRLWSVSSGSHGYVCTLVC